MFHVEQFLTGFGTNQRRLVSQNGAPDGRGVQNKDIMPPADAIDLASAQILNSPDVRGWPITTAIRHVDCRPDNVRLTFDKQAGPGRWPDQPFGGDGTLQYTVWLFLLVEGRWIGSGFVEMWSGRDGVGDGISDFVNNWYYDGHRWGAMAGHAIAVGELIGFMVTAGDARNNGSSSVQERSNVVLLRAPANDTGLFSFEMPAPVPGPPNSPPTPLDPPPLAPPADLARLEELLKQAEDLATLRHAEILAAFDALRRVKATLRIPFLGDSVITFTVPK